MQQPGNVLTIIAEASERQRDADTVKARQSRTASAPDTVSRQSALSVSTAQHSCYCEQGVSTLSQHCSALVLLWADSQHS